MEISRGTVLHDGSKDLSWEDTIKSLSYYIQICKVDNNKVTFNLFNPNPERTALIRVCKEITTQENLLTFVLTKNIHSLYKKKYLFCFKCSRTPEQDFPKCSLCGADTDNVGLVQTKQIEKFHEEEDTFSISTNKNTYAVSIYKDTFDVTLHEGGDIDCYDGAVFFKKNIKSIYIRESALFIHFGEIHHNLGLIENIEEATQWLEKVNLNFNKEEVKI